MKSFENILEKYRRDSISEREKGYRFERLMQNFLKFGRYYEGAFEEVWLWNEFPYNQQFGGKDIGIDIVAKTDAGDYWAVQCKCYEADARIYLDDVANFVALSNSQFKDDTGKKTFEHKLWIDTTKSGFDLEAQNLVDRQPVKPQRLGYIDLASTDIDWEKIEKGKALKYESYKPREHQREAINKAHTHFKAHNRGKMIMACGTGKTFTSLKIAEKETEKNGVVLFLVPSIALLGQTLREWMLQRETDIYPICVCSDSGVSNKKDDSIADSADNLLFPASTDVKTLSKRFNVFVEKQKKNGGLIVIFSTYQSIGEVQKLQKKVNFEFDLTICDEAHRTTGVKFLNENESYFTEVHNDRLLKSKKRLYMTATPRIYADGAKNKAKDMDAILCSMDDAELYGEEFYRIGFGEAVRKDLLSDYKVIVLTMEESQLDSEILAKVEDGKVKPDTVLQIMGCINALHKKSLTDKEIFESIDPEPMHSAVAFCRTIEESKSTAKVFEVIRDAYLEKSIEADHVDGGMRAQEREKKMQWLKSFKRDKKCRILHNVRCLSEGVDVPALDAILFLSAKNSQIDVIQSVGRVMRKAEGKKYGYIIIPIVVKPDEEPDKVLDSDEKYKVIWAVLNALRAHDERFNAEINAINYNRNPAAHIRVSGVEIGGRATDSDASSGANKIIQEQLTLKFETLHKEIYAKIVQKCGEKAYWENWAKDVADIAKRHIEQIKDIVKKNGNAKKEFENYLKGLRKNINPSVSEEAAIEMLAQHKITQPVFDAIFGDFSFAKNNSVSKSLQSIADILTKSADNNDFSKLDKFYSSVTEKANSINDAEGKQKIIVELYDKFFRTAFPKVTEKLGIVYTPLEVVDFIIHSVEDILKAEFGRSMSDENVHILDPFTGTGTFITRLLQSGIIKNEDLKRKYEKEIHANEIVLLAYYIASINIENVYHSLQEQAEKIIEFPVEKYSGLMAADSKKPVWKVNSYKAFFGICLTDTFQLGENADFLTAANYFGENSEQVLEQKKTPLKIIIGNPPYSIGQKSANDNAQNQSYPNLEKRIAESYVASSSANLNKAAYDAYIKAFRWASDRLDKSGGIIAFVSNGSWLDNNGLDGFRKSIEKEFDKIYIFNLRGNQRTSGELSRKEGGKIFGSGSRTPIAVSVLVRKGEKNNVL
jgi:predicted helicase